MPRQMTIEAPNKKVYKIEVPDDATEDDAFGYVKHLMEQEAAHQEKTGFGPSFSKGILSGKSQLESGAGVVAEELGFPNVAKTLTGYSEEAAKKAQEVAEPTTEEDVKAAEEQGLLSGLKARGNKAILEKAGELAGRAAPVIAATATGNPLAIGAAGAGEYLAGAGHIKELGGSNEAALTAAAPIAALNTVGAPMGIATKALAGTAGKSFLADTAKNALSNVAVATPTAIAAEDIARGAANKDLLNAEEMKDIGKDVLTVAPLFGAGHATLNRLSSKPTAKNPLAPPVVEEPTTEQTNILQDNIPEPTVKGKQPPAEQTATDYGVVHDTDSLARNFDLSKMPKSYNLWNVRNASGDGFRSYASLEDSVKGINDLLKAYKHLHQIDTPIELTNRYAPKKDHNNPEAYAKNIADHLGLDSVNDKIDLDDPAVRSKVIWAIARQEGVVHPNKNVQGKPYTPEGKPVQEATEAAGLTPEQIRDQLGLGKRHPAYNTLKDLDFTSVEGLDNASRVVEGLRDTPDISPEHSDVLDDILNTIDKERTNISNGAHVEAADIAYTKDPTQENHDALVAAREKANTAKPSELETKEAGVDTAIDEALGEHAQPKVEQPQAVQQPAATEQPKVEPVKPNPFIPEHLAAKAEQPKVEPVKSNPFIPEHLAARGAEREESVKTAESDLLSNPSTVVRDPEGKLTFVQSVKNSVKNFGKNQVDKWLGLTKINEVYGDYVGDQLSAYWGGHELDNIGRILPRVLAEGGLKKMPDGRSEIATSPIEMHDGTVKNASIKNMLDQVKGEKNGQDILHEILWVKDQERMQQVNPKNVSQRVSKDPEGFAKKVEAVNTILKSKPVYQDALNMLKEVNKMRVDYLKDTGQLTDDMYKFFKEQDLYVPNYTLRDEATDVLGPSSGKKITIGNTSTRAFRERTPSDHDINPMENITNEMIRSYLGGARNYHKMQTAEQLQKIGKASYVGRTNLKEKQGNFGFLKNGKREFYQLHDPTDYPVMQVLSQSVNPIMIASRVSAGIIRTAATNTPNFWLRQLFIDPLGASMTSDVGWITPAHTMYQVTKALTGNKKIFDRLMDAGAIGHIDPTLDPRDARAFYREVGTRTVSKSGLDKFKAKLRQGSEYMHILIDGGTRCAVYEKAYAKGIKKGMSPEKADGYAVMKAREVINFGVSGNAESQRVARQMIPFLGASINALEVMRRNLTMEHVKLEDRPAYRKQFLNKVYTVGMLSAVHALYMAGDPDYEEAMNNFKYSKVAIPTGDKDDPLFGMAIPPDMAFLYYLPALAVQYSIGTKDGQQVWDIFKEQLLTMAPGGVGYTGGVPIPQIAKPLVDLAYGKSSFTGSDIVPKAEQGLPAWAQGQYTASKTSKALGRITGASPPKIDAFFKGYLGSFGDLALWGVDGMLDATGLADNIQKPDRHWTQFPGAGLQSSFGTYLASQSVEDMYKHKEKADQARKLYNQLGSQGAAGQEDFKNFTSDPNNIKLAQLATVLDRYAKKESDIMKQIHTLQNSDISSAEMTRRIKEWKEQRNNVAKEAEKYYDSVMGKGMAKGGVVDKIKAQHFGPKDSTIVSSLMHPQEAATRAGDWLQEKMRIASGNPYEEYTPEQQAQAGLDIAGLANTGAMPFSPMTGKGTLGMFAGLKSNTADLGAHETAQAMETAGKSPEEILKATGWFKNPDEGWRYEISDANARMKLPMSEMLESKLFGPTKGNYKLSDVLEHPELYKAYPDVAEVPFTVREGFMDYRKGLQGWRGDNGIGLTPYVQDPLGTLLHEAQHEIQGKENWAQGGNANTVMEAIPHDTKLEMAKETIGKLSDKLASKSNLLAELDKLRGTPEFNVLHEAGRKNNEAWDAYWKASMSKEQTNKEELKAAQSAVQKQLLVTQDEIANKLFGATSYRLSKEQQDLLSLMSDPKKVQSTIDEMAKLNKDIADLQSGDPKALEKHTNMHEMYKRLAGETEARNVTDRRRMSGEERIAKPSWETQEYPFIQQFIARQSGK